MTIRIDSDLIEALIGLYLVIALCTMVIVVIWNVLKVVLKLVWWIFLRARGANDVEELRIRSEARHAEWVKERIARGQPATLRGVLVLLGRRMWTAYRHPTRAWRGEFDPPKKGTTEAGDRKL
jgi:hypothetical protein